MTNNHSSVDRTLMSHHLLHWVQTIFEEPLTVAQHVWCWLSALSRSLLGQHAGRDGTMQIGTIP